MPPLQNRPHDGIPAKLRRLPAVIAAWVLAS